jgi:hypothetical protein
MMAQGIVAGRLALPGFVAGYALVLLAYPLAQSIGLGGFHYGYWTYNAGLASLSWFDTGFARRELQGTLLHPFTGDPMARVAWFHIITYVMLTGAGIVLGFRKVQPLTTKLALSATFLAVLTHIATDVGRTDAIVMVCGLCAAWATREARWTIASGAMFIAQLFHETGPIVIGPIVVAVAYISGSWRQWRTPDAALGAALIVAMGAAYLLSVHPHGDAATFARRLRIGTPELQVSADAAISVQMAGFRIVALSKCMNDNNPYYALRVACGIVLCALFTLGLMPRFRWIALLMSLTPFIFLSLVAVDIGRWATFSAFSLFTLASTTAAETSTDGNRPVGLALALAGAFLMAAFLRTSDVAPVMPAVEVFATLHGHPGATSMAGYDLCNPGWRAEIGAPIR